MDSQPAEQKPFALRTIESAVPLTEYEKCISVCFMLSLSLNIGLAVKRSVSKHYF